MLVKRPVRYSDGVPDSSLFADGEASPIVIDIQTGFAYYLSSTNEVTAIVSPLQLLGRGDLVTDAWGVQKVSLPLSLFHGVWTFDVPSSMWFLYENGVQVYSSATITSVGGVAKLLTTSLKTAVLLESRGTPRYQPNRGGLFSMAGWFPSKLAGGVRDFGLFTTENGVFFRLKSDGNLYAVLRRAGVEVLEQLIDTSGLTGFDVEKNNIYDIQFQWRSAGNYNFFIGDPDKGVSILVHQFKLLGTLTSASLEDPALPAAFKATRVTADVEMRVACADITTENGMPTIYQYESNFSEAVPVTGTNIPVLITANPLQINGKTNTRELQLARISVTCSKKAVFKVWATRDPAAITGETLITINSGSFVQTDSPNKAAGAVRATALTTASCRNITAVPVEAAIAREVNNPLLERINFSLVRGDYLVVTCTASTATADCVVEWGESI